MRTGQINVQTENIFPIIKKFLYSDHEIFLRELVSNAVDASQKLKVLASTGEYKGELGDLKVEVLLDKEAKTLTIRDNGIGMTAEEIDKYINQIAFSGAEEFVKQYEGKEGAESIIGHFGLGFYSAFMVAEKVQIRTLSRHEGAQAVQWESNGSPEFTLSEIEKDTRGTDIVLFINEESAEFLEKSRIQGILDKYCKFLPIPVFFGTKVEYIDSPEGEKDEDGKVKRVSIDVPNQVNNPKPAWTSAPVDLKEEDYNSFYRELYPMAETPLFWIHLNVDYPFNLTGILYFPKVGNNFEMQRNKIQLYSNQVFVTDAVENIVPEFLMLLHGVIDSPDIPLNVSRSFLQADSNVKKINSYITKKVADKLGELYKKDRKVYEEKWNDIGLFVKYGMISEDKFAEKGKDFALLKNTKGEYFTLPEYKEKVKAIQTDKNDQTVYLYATDVNKQDGFIQSANKKDYDVLVMDSPIDSHFIQHLEMKEEKTQLKRVDADVAEKLIEKEDSYANLLTEDQSKKVKEIFEKAISNATYSVDVAGLSPEEMPVTVTMDEFMRRMKDMAQMGG